MIGWIITGLCAALAYILAGSIYAYLFNLIRPFMGWRKLKIKDGGDAFGFLLWPLQAAVAIATLMFYVPFRFASAAMKLGDRHGKAIEQHLPKRGK